MANTGMGEKRPLSPHLQIYRPNLTMMMSILHRITGAALYFAILLGVWWLAALAAGPAYFAFVDGLFRSWFGLVVLAGTVYGLFHHLMGGVRHLIWDTGAAFSIEDAERMDWLSLAAAAALTAIVFVAGYAAL